MKESTCFTICDNYLCFNTDTIIESTVIVRPCVIKLLILNPIKYVEKFTRTHSYKKFRAVKNEFQRRQLLPSI